MSPGTGKANVQVPGKMSLQVIWEGISLQLRQIRLQFQDAIIGQCKKMTWTRIGLARSLLILQIVLKWTKIATRFKKTQSQDLIVTR